MQYDLFGAPIQMHKRKKRRAIPPLPDNGWRPPKEYPRLSDAKVISLDTETKDLHLEENGPGWARGDSHIVGVSLCVDENNKWYFPIRHEVDTRYNLDPTHTINYLKDVLSTNIPKVGANLIYDIGTLADEGIEVGGDLYDVQYAEALLAEDKTVALDDLATRYLGVHKESELLYQWSSEMFGGPPTGKQRKNIYQISPLLTGPYAESDADLPLQILPLQIERLIKYGLYNLFLRECKLIRPLIAMRQHGVRVDLDKAEQLHGQLIKKIRKKQRLLNRDVGIPVNVDASRSLAKAFDRIGLEYPRTEKTNEPSFTKSFLESVDHPVAKRVIEIRQLDKLANVFIQSYILEKNIDGRIYCQFHPLRSDGFGTRSGRFSSTDPNLQNIPSRTELGKLIRTLFIPDIGHERWRKQDASQIEYRFFAHYAVGEGSIGIRKAYRKDPRTDYHEFTRQLIKSITSIELDRKPTKNINFGFLYGMGEEKTANDLHLKKDKARELFDAYHTALPFVRATMNECIQFASLHGYITTITGRRSRFNKWEPIGNRDKDLKLLSKRKALKKWGMQIQRAKTYRALNRRLQGSAADFMKEGMLQCYENGLFDEVGYPLLTVHDELNFSDPGGKDKYYAEIINTCEHAIKARVPLLIDEEVGPNWGNVKERKRAA